MSIKYFLKKCFVKAFLLTYHGYKSYSDYLTTKKFVNIQFSREFTGGAVLLLALYEKNKIRDDIINLLKEAKNQNLYIIAVNTLKILPENYPNDLIDVYIEKDNFGRDFGSYKCGMKYIYDKKISDHLSRLLILNDSLFYSKNNLKSFLNTLKNSEIDIIGATENREISHHLGSFCVSINSKIANHNNFKKFWGNYKNSNLRPFVIKRGELKLSQTLKSLASSESNFKAIYDVNFLEKNLWKNEELFKNFSYYQRQGGTIHWEHKPLIKYFMTDEELLSTVKSYSKIKGKKLTTTQLQDFLENFDFNQMPNGKNIKRKIISLYLHDFSKGSQIHNACVLLPYLGLPIIKLDLMFREVCNFNDFLKIKDQLSEEEQQNFEDLLTSRLFGYQNLYGILGLSIKHGFI